ncbi:MAG: transposase [Acidobacteria bacterium]|nr:transposase [Acidobacteriota bacterium]
MWANQLRIYFSSLAYVLVSARRRLALQGSPCAEVQVATIRLRLLKIAARMRVTAWHIWKAHGLKPHFGETFKVSNDPEFTEKLVAIVGLYLNPPEHALVLGCDEKSQIQALDRTQPGLPLKRGRGETMTHDYKRNGPATLFAAVNAVTGKVISFVPATPPPPGVVEVPAPAGRDHTRRQGTSHHCRQFRHAQTRQDAALVYEASAIPNALHAH